MAGENKVLVIDSNLRTISMPSGMTNIGVAGDKEVTRLYFKMPRFYGGFDLVNFEIYINYFNAIGDGDIVGVDDFEINNSNIVFSWLVDECMTAYAGNVRFGIHMERKRGSVIEKEFNTTFATSRVLENLNPTEQITSRVPSVIEKLKEDLLGRFSGNIDKYLRYSGMAADAAVTGDKIKKLEHSISSPYNFKGSRTYATLPSSALVNDTYYCSDKKCRYTWNGSGWYQSSMNESDYVEEINTIAGEFEQVYDKLDDVADDLYQNLIPRKSTFDLPGMVAAGGVIQNGGYRTGLIKCEGYKYLKYKTNLGSSCYEVAFYNENMEILDDICIIGKASFKERIIDVSELGAYYVQVSGYANSSVGASADTSMCMIYDRLALNELGEIEGTVTKLHDNIFHRLTSYTALFDQTGYVQTNDTIYSGMGYHTDYVDCSGYEYLRYKTNISIGGFEVAFYDTDKILISECSIEGDGMFIEKILNIKSYGAAYIRLSTIENPDKGAYADTCYMHLYNRDVLTELDKLNSKTTANKSILIFGDSITATATMDEYGSDYVEGVYSNWPKYIPELLGTSDFTNYACDGAHYADFSHATFYQKMSNQLEAAITTTTGSPDIIIFALGTNDQGQTPVDNYETAMSVEDIWSLDKTKMYQAIRYAMWRIRDAYKDAKCYACTPIQRGDREPFLDISEAIVKMANRYNFTVIDCEKELGIIRENETGANHMYLSDGLHTNPRGKRLMAEFICNRIKQDYI